MQVDPRTRALKPELLIGGLTFPECGRWHEGKLWFSDVDEGRIKTLDLSGRCDAVVEIPGFAAGLGWAPNGNLLIVGASERKLFRWDGAVLNEHADLCGLGQTLFNDMVVRGNGEAYVGTVSHDLLSGAEPTPACIALVRNDGTSQLVADGLALPNGMVITPDGRTLICGETLGARYTAFDIEEDGILSNARLWAEVPGETPDGCCLDAEGAVWCSSFASRSVVRVLPGGALTDRIPVTNTNPYGCMLGGAERRTLFILCADTHERPKTLELKSGKILAVEVDVPGAGLP